MRETGDIHGYAWCAVITDDALLQTVQARYGRIAFFINDDSAVSKSLALYGEWAENEIGFLRHFIPEGTTVLDVGAYLGTHSLAFARFTGPTGHVVSFEAQPLAFAVLQRNVTANALPQIALMNVVVADHAGMVRVPSIEIEERGNYGSASLRTQLLPDEVGLTLGTGQDATRELDVSAITIDSLQLEACSLIKIDAEGTEDVVLRGAQETISRLRPVVYAECNSIADGMRSIGILRGLGYEVRLHLADAFNVENFNGSSENIFGHAREAALVAVPAADGGRLDTIPLRSCELLVRIETADDLALALLNKPQYPGEVLAKGAAAKSGAAAWLDDMARLRSEGETLRGDLEKVQRTLAEDAQRDRDLWAKELAAAKITMEGMARERDDALARAEAAHVVVDAMVKERDDALARAEAGRVVAEGMAKERDDALARAEAARVVVEGMASERDDAFARAEAAREFVESMARERDDAAAYAEAAMRQARAARSATDAAMATSEEMSRTLERLQRDHQEEAVRSQASLKAIHASTSWRITGPLRALARFLRVRP